MAQRISIVVHGGAGFIPDEAIPAARAGCAAAARAGFAELLSASDVPSTDASAAVRAVEAAVRVLEDNPRFNAGIGSCLTRAGTVELDGLIMDGRGLQAGAATGITRVKHPVSLARAIMQHSPHVFLSGPATDAFGERFGLEMVANDAFITPLRRAQLEQFLASGASIASLSPPSAAVSSPHVGHDTVGAVACDAYGNVAAATSTGGLTGKWTGRVGDTPVIGSGGYADNAVGAVSTTGTGEYIMRYCLAHRVLQAVAREKDAGGTGDAAATRAVASTLAHMRDRMADPGEGVICVTPGGDIGIAHSSLRMSWAGMTVSAHDASASPLTACGAELGEASDMPGVRCNIEAWRTLADRCAAGEREWEAAE